MTTKLFLMCVTVASAAYSGAAMPTEAEVEKAVPKVERMLASEKVALKSGKMTRADVAAAAMKLAAGADDEAAKLLLMKGAFILHVKDGDLEKAVKTMNALETAIADMPPQIVTNIIETALLGLSNKAAHDARLYQLLDEAKVSLKGSDVGEAVRTVVDGYTWSYRLKNGEAMVVAENVAEHPRAVWPNPAGHVVIPSALDGVKVTSIGDRAFRGLRMTSVSIPSSVTNIDAAPFAWCGGLMRIDVASNSQSFASVDGLLYTKDLKELVMCPPGLTSVTIPKSVTSVRAGAFHGCQRMSSLTIQSSVRDIKTWAFSGCRGLVSVIIPESVTNMEGGVFWNCSALASVTFQGEIPSSQKDIFHGCRNLKAIHVSANAKSWAGMTEWQGVPLVFDVSADGVKELTNKDRTTVQSIIDGMIKVPGKDYWLSETELTQGQWESVMGDNPSEHKGATFPVERVSRNDCDVFLEKLNQTKEVRGSQFVFSLPTEGEWLSATRTKGDILDRAWVLENSSTQTHAVATKAANELGFYDMQGNVWEWLANDKVSKGCRRGGAFSEGKGGCSVHRWIHTPRGRRYNSCGLRLAAHLRQTNDADETIEAKATGGQAKIDAARTAVDNIKGAVTTWMISKRRSMPPATLLALVKGDDDEKPVLAGGEKALVDPWGNGYMWQVKSNRFAIISSGPDGKFGTDDDIRSEKDWNAEKDVARQTEGKLKRAR